MFQSYGLQHKHFADHIPDSDHIHACLADRDDFRILLGIECPYQQTSGIVNLHVLASRPFNSDLFLSSQDNDVRLAAIFRSDIAYHHLVRESGFAFFIKRCDFVGRPYRRRFRERQLRYRSLIQFLIVPVNIIADKAKIFITCRISNIIKQLKLMQLLNGKF